jgi:hypothetical protein
MQNRSTEDVLQEHLELARKGDLDTDLERNYASDVVVMTTLGSFRGHEGVRESCALLREAVSTENARFTRRSTTGELAVVKWTTKPDPALVFSAEETFLIRKGKIVIQTIQVDLTAAEN